MGAKSLLKNGELRDDLPRRYGRLTYIRVAFLGPGKEPNLELRCDCGKVVIRCWQHVRSGRTASCGCFGKEIRRKALTIHGRSKTLLHRVWCAMIERCEDKNNKCFYLYGGRGIKVCDRWRNSFSNFLADMGERPGKEYSLDRHPDKDGNYEPGNVRWATSSQQGRNKRNNRLITHNGETKCLADWADSSGIPASNIYSRMKIGWSFERAISTPVRRQLRFSVARPSLG